MSEVTVYKLDEKGQLVWQYPAQVLQRRLECVRLEAFFNRDDLDLGFAVFKRGDRFVETFYSDRWYNVFAVYDRDSGRLKGWYCNICRPAELGQTAVRCEDLALDMWVTPDSQVQILDRDEYEALGLSGEEKRESMRALRELERAAEKGDLPR